MKLLVKLGGTLLDAPESRARLASQIAAARLDGAEIVVVHGGGKQMTRLSGRTRRRKPIRQRPARHHDRRLWMRSSRCSPAASTTNWWPP